MAVVTKFLCLTLLYSSGHLYAGDCSDVWAQTAKLLRTEHEEYTARQKRDYPASVTPPAVALLWYPRTEADTWTHTKLEAGPVVYNTGAGGGYIPQRSTYRALKAARLHPDAALFRVKFRTSPEKQIAMEQFLEENLGWGKKHNCIGGICDALDQTEIFHIPKFFRVNPTLSMLYLAAAYKVGNPQIESIEYRGRDLRYSLLAPKVAVDLLTVAAPATALAAYVWAAYHIMH